MLSTLKNALKIPELRKKMLWTLFFVAVFRMGTNIPVPGVDPTILKQASENSGLFGFYDLISGGAFSRFSILALGVMPYINASIIMQLLTVAIPPLEQLQKEGKEGRDKIQNATRYVSIIIAIILGIGTLATITNSGGAELGLFEYIVVIIALVAGSVFCIWLGDQITVKGFGNGTSILIFINIISRVPLTIYSFYTLYEAGTLDIVSLVLFILGAFVLIVATISKVPASYNV